MYMYIYYTLVHKTICIMMHVLYHCMLIYRIYRNLCETCPTGFEQERNLYALVKEFFKSLNSVG